MRIDALLICSDAREDTGAINLYGVGRDTYVSDVFPARVEFRLYVRVAGSHDDAEHHLIVQAVDSNGDLAFESLQAFRFSRSGRNPALPVEVDSRAQVVVTAGMTVVRPCTLVLKAMVDGGRPEAMPLFVREE